MLDGATANNDLPDQPLYRFDGKLPTALAHLCDQPRWVAWSYRCKDGRWTKPPIDPRSGRTASVSNPDTWGTFEVALAGMERHGLAGVGLVLTVNDDITGIDLDDCITDAGFYSPLAAEVIEYGETYAEISPSGEGIRIFARGKIDAALKDDKVGIEVYGTGRYLTVTGQQIEGTPSEIREAPRTLARLKAVVEAARGVKPTKPNGKATRTEDFFGNVNAAALTHLDLWVPFLHPTARKHATGAWRVSSQNLGRDLEEDLAYHPDGIRDHGEESGHTAIDAVMKYGDEADAKAAALWLCHRMGVEPTALGWRPTRSMPNGNRRPGEERDSSGEAVAPAAEQPGPNGNGRNAERRTQAQVLIELAAKAEVQLFHAPDGTGYADILVDGHRETWALRGAGFRRWLRRAYYQLTGGAPNSDAMSTAMGIIEARAHYDGEERLVYLRVATVPRRIYIDLCDASWRAIEISEDGWKLVETPPVRFRRTVGMLPLPEPVRGGQIAELRNHVRVDDNSFVLIVSWLLQVLRGEGPYPILALTGEQGTGKSVTADQLRRLVDPHTTPLRSLPRDTRDLYVAAINGHVLVFDNLSGISARGGERGGFRRCLCRRPRRPSHLSASGPMTDWAILLFE